MTVERERHGDDVAVRPLVASVTVIPESENGISWKVTFAPVIR